MRAWFWAIKSRDFCLNFDRLEIHGFEICPQIGLQSILTARVLPNLIKSVAYTRILAVLALPRPYYHCNAPIITVPAQISHSLTVTRVTHPKGINQAWPFQWNLHVWQPEQISGCLEKKFQTTEKIFTAREFWLFFNHPRRFEICKILYCFRGMFLTK